MKTIKLWDIRFPDRPPVRLSVADGLASAMVRAGVAAPVDPAEAGALMAGGALSPADLTEVTLESGNSRRMVRVALPLSVVMIGAGLGVLAAIGAPVAGTPTPVISFSLPSATVPEGNSGPTAVPNTINVTRNGVTGDLVVKLSTGGTATAGTDYNALPLTVTVPDGQNSIAFNLSVGGDTAVEPDENIIIYAQLAAYPGATASKTVTIANDDAAAVAPTIVSAPTFTGTAQVGQTLTGQHGTYNNSPTSYANQWQSSADGGSSWADISGATALNYLLTSNESGKIVRLGEVASNATGPSPANYSAATGAVAAAGGSALMAPQNTDVIVLADSRGENGNGATLTATGLSVLDACIGMGGWIGPETGQKLRLAEFPNFSISASKTSQAAQIPRLNAVGNTSSTGFYRGGEVAGGSNTKGLPAAAAHSAGIVLIRYGTNDTDTVAQAITQMKFILDNLRPNQLKIVMNDNPKGIRSDGSASGSNGIRLRDWATELNKLSYNSGDPAARPDVFVVDSFSMIYDPSSGANYLNFAQYLRDGLHDTQYGARQLVRLVDAGLTAALGAAYTSLPARITLPTANPTGSAIAPTANVPFVHTNPNMSPGTNGQASGTAWRTAPLPAGIAQGWLVAGNTINTGVGIDVVATKDGTDDEGFPTQRFAVTGTLYGATFSGSISGTTLTVDSVSKGEIRVGQLLDATGVTLNTAITALGTGTGGPGTYTVNTAQTATTRTIMAGMSYTLAMTSSQQVAGQLTASKRIRLVGKRKVSLGSVGLTSVRLYGSVTCTESNTRNVALSTMNSSNGAPGDRIGYQINVPNGDSATGQFRKVQSQPHDLANPNMDVANGGPGVMGTIGNATVGWEIALANFTGDNLAVSATVEFSRTGMLLEN